MHFLFVMKSTDSVKIARTWKQPRWPSADEWIRKLWYIYTMEHYSAVKKNSFESSPCTSPKHAAPYVRHGLAIQFLHDSKHFLMKTNSDLYFGLSIMDNFKFFLFFQIKFKLTLTQWISCYLFYFWKLNNYAANFYAVCCEFNFSFTFLIPFT